MTIETDKDFILSGYVSILDAENSYLTTCDLTGDKADCFQCSVEVNGKEYTYDINKHDAVDLINAEYKGA